MSTPDPTDITARILSLRPEHEHGFSPAEERGIMDEIYARGDRLMVWFLASHFALGLLLATYHDTWLATLVVGGGALGSFALCAWRFPRSFLTRAYSGVAQQAFVALHIYQLHGQSEQHFWYFTALTMMIVYQDALCLWPGALLIILQHSIFAVLHNAGMPVHFFPEPYVGFTKLFYHFGIALVHVSICGYWAHLLRKQSLGDAWRKWQLREDQRLLEEQLGRLRESEAALTATTEALAESSRRQRAILDNSSDAMWIRDLQGCHVVVNSAFARLADRPMHTIAGLRLADLVGPDEAAAALAHDQEVVRTGGAVTRERAVNLTDGRHVLEITITPVLDAQGAIAATSGHARDVTEQRRLETERRRAEARLQRAQKLESLGLLAGGIAHDFNNLLVGILGNAELARAELTRAAVPGKTASLESIVQIERGAQRAAELTRQMLAYAGKGKFDIARLDMSTIVREMADLLRTVLSKKATLQLELAPSLPLVEADATQLRQVVMNLITNASDALGDESGTVRLRTTRARLTAGEFVPSLGQEELPAGEYVVVEVEDSGVGMDAETMARIFDPFFTTKFVGRGLGLAAVLGILRGHQGAIQVASAPGCGSSFRVYLPAITGTIAGADSAAAGEGMTAHPTTARAPMSGRVLVVDDEPSVREFASHVLERAGFAVRAAADGAEAVELMRADATPFTIVLLDALMPRMNGEEAFVELRRMAPRLPVLFTSGYSDGVLTKRLLSEELVGFIQKPYAIGALLDAISELTARTVADPATTP